MFGSLSTVISPSQIVKAAKRNTLQNNYDFITRKAFRKMSKSQFQKYLKIIDEYPTSDQALFTPDWEGWANQKLNGYEKLASVLKEYISGQNLELCRSQLMYVDFSVINHILNLKLDSGNKKKVFKVPVHGSPLSAFTHAIYAVAGSQSGEQYDGIRISII